MERNEWVFTFGVGDPENKGRFIKFSGTYEEAREKMIRRYGRNWAFQYSSESEAGVKKYGLLELKEE